MNRTIHNIFPGLLLFLVFQVNAYCNTEQTITQDTSYFVPYDNDFNLLLSAEKGNLDNVRMLMDRGAEVNTKTFEGVTALMYAADNGNVEMVKFLLEKGADPDIKPYNGLTALMSSAINNHFEVAELLVKNPENANLKDIYGVTALHFACSYNHFELADMLIFYGADMEAADNNGNTPLITASYNNCYQAADILLQNGANIHATDHKYYNALMTAIQERNDEIIDLLIEKGADIFYTNPLGISPLVLAIRYENGILTERLFNSGATLTKQELKKIDCHAIARENRNEEILDILIANDVKPLILPDFSRLSFGTSIGFNLTDFMHGINAGLVDSKYNIGINTGVYFRPAPIRVLHSPLGDTSYQYWERRFLINAGIEKRFAVNNKASAFQTGPLIGVHETLTFGGYRGSTSRPATAFITVPELGWFYRNRTFLLKAHYEYTRLNVPTIKNGRICISALFTISIKRKAMSPKKITWLNEE